MGWPPASTSPARPQDDRQFGELGYDYSINTCSDGVTISEDCRVAAKPVRWDYRDAAARYRVYQVMAALSGLKRDHAVFQTTDFTWDVGVTKRLHLNGSDMNVVVAGNFQVTDLAMAPGFGTARGMTTSPENPSK